MPSETSTRLLQLDIQPPAAGTYAPRRFTPPSAPSSRQPPTGMPPGISCYPKAADPGRESIALCGDPEIRSIYVTDLRKSAAWVRCAIPGIRALPTAGEKRDGRLTHGRDDETIGWKAGGSKRNHFPIRRPERCSSKPLTCGNWSGRRDSNPRPPPWQGGALPAEPRPHASGDLPRLRPLILPQRHRGCNLPSAPRRAETA
jgi:hypothetical protein